MISCTFSIFPHLSFFLFCLYLLSLLWLQVAEALALMHCHSYSTIMLLKIHPSIIFNNVITWTWFLGPNRAKWSRHQPSDYSIRPMSRGRNQYGWAKRAGTAHYDQFILWLLFCMRLWNISLRLHAFSAIEEFSSHSGSTKILGYTR